jgi:hypothetical protein
MPITLQELHKRRKSPVLLLILEGVRNLQQPLPEGVEESRLTLSIYVHGVE